MSNIKMTNKDNFSFEELPNIDFEIEDEVLNTLESQPSQTDVVLKDFSIIEEEQDQPYGIIECMLSDIDVIMEELKISRNSIMVISSSSPIKNRLHSTEYFDYKSNSLYKDFTHYTNTHQYKKFIVTPKHLSSLIDTLGTINDYSLIIVDMDALLNESSYNTTIESIIDYYYTFDEESRCLYTSNYHILTNPIWKNEKKTVIKPQQQLDRHIKLIEASNIIGTLEELIERIPREEKILTFYFSVAEAKQIIQNLPQELHQECSIVCNENNKRIAEHFYSSIENNTSILNKRITLWATKHLDIVLEEKYHLIIVSDTQRGSTILPLKTISQLYSLNKSCQNNTLSDTLIFNTTTYYNGWEEDYSSLEERAYKIIQLTDAADCISQGDQSLIGIFNIAKNVIKEKAKGKIRGRFSPFKLTRKDISGKSAIAYMNFDSMKSRTNLIKELYSNKENLYNILSSIYTIDSFNKVNSRTTAKQEEVKENLKVLQKKLKKNDWLYHLEEIESKSIKGELTEQYITLMSKRGNSVQRKLYKSFLRLYPYIDTIELVNLLKEVKCNNTIPLKNLSNAIIFWALDDNHPFKKAIYSAFSTKARYLNHEIASIMIPILHYHLHQNYTLISRKVISLFKAFFKTIRPKKEYIILNDDRFKNHKARIGASDNNILRLFNT